MNTARPHMPEPVEKLRARFEAALVRTFESLDEIPPDGPPLANVFDFEDGARVIVTKERVFQGAPALFHVSLSAFRREAIYSNPNPETALRLYWSKLTDRAFLPDKDGILISPKGYAHVFLCEDFVGRRWT